jgi:pyruvate dehydrogenase E1 component alpha subunit
MDQKLLAEYKERDPLKLLRSKIDNDAEKKRIEAQVDKELDDAIEFAKNSPQPSVEEFLAGMRDF